MIMAYVCRRGLQLDGNCKDGSNAESSLAPFWLHDYAVCVQVW